MTAFFRGWFAVPLWQRVLGAMLIGVLLGLFWPAATSAIAFIGVRVLFLVGLIF